MKRGEMWWFEPPYAKARPHLILTRGPVVEILSDVLAIPATRTMRGLPTEVELSVADGMPAPGVLTADNLSLIEKVYLTRRIMRLSSSKMLEVCGAVRAATGC